MKLIQRRRYRGKHSPEVIADHAEWIYYPRILFSYDDGLYIGDGTYEPEHVPERVSA